MAEEDINKMMSSDGEISSMAERAASLLRQLIEDGCAAAKPLAEMVEYCAKHAAGEAQGKEEEVLDGESSDEEETDILRLEASLMGVENMLSARRSSSRTRTSRRSRRRRTSPSTAFTVYIHLLSTATQTKFSY
ncbi:hypothetical protein OsI_35972 [Oryza sativa Indica Group]|uniref:Uncharacterized protein n=2 Tax=Oryza sativa TaxID=4530 RepID=Q5VS21_ORYSJ|nr:hypothetical protein OsI_35972 [Oryza sativa Indica Group]EAZ35590.1 hypothetical protein OsJ_19877 [Oryza sativa Japonica Group]BAD67754.1 hypothetical protein [Oryza sativa Japonica Group]